MQQADDHMKTKEETEVILLQAKEFQRYQKLEKVRKKGLKLFCENMALLTP